MSFKEKFDKYQEAVDGDLKQAEFVIAWLEQFRANFEYNEIEKVINFFKGYLARTKFEKTKAQELSWHIDDK